MRLLLALTHPLLSQLMNATLGNAVELIVAIIALAKCELQVVQSSLIGSVLSNLLLVLGESLTPLAASPRTAH